MATSPVLTISEIQGKLRSYISEIQQVTKLLAVLKVNTDRELSDPQGSAGYSATLAQMDEIYAYLKNTSDALASFVSDPDFWVYPYIWEAGVTGILTSFDIVAGPNGTITAKASEPVAATLTSVFADLAAGDYVRISNSEVAANDGIWEVVSAASGVLTVSGTLDATGTPDTSMKIEVAHKVT